MTRINRRTLVLAACVTTAFAGICHARAQSASPAGSGSNSGTTTSRRADARTSILRPASRWTGLETSGVGNETSWGAGMKSYGTNNNGMWSAGAGIFGSAVQPGGIWRSTSAPSARDENSAAAGEMGRGTQSLISSGKMTPLHPKTGFRESSTEFPSPNSASNSPMVSHSPSSTTSHIPAGGPSDAGYLTASRSRIGHGAAFGTRTQNGLSGHTHANTTGSHRASPREYNTLQGPGDLGGGLLGITPGGDLQSGSSTLRHSGTRADDRKGTRHRDRDSQVH
jgi:hypothetical protein